MLSSDSIGLATVIRKEEARLRPGGGADRFEGDAAPTPPEPWAIGLALSGGGIRSATFSLGVLQALAQNGRLSSFDYLSTVSGGGYIGSWLSAWIHRSTLCEVQTALGHCAPNSSQDPNRPRATTKEPPEVTWLRRYSNYLAPRVGPLSVDSLTLAATWLRNVALNLIVLLSCLAVIFLAPLLVLNPLAKTVLYNRAFGFAAAWFGLLFVGSIAFNLWHQGLPVNRLRNWMVSTRGVFWTVIIPGFLAAGAGAIWMFAPHMQPLEELKSGVKYVASLLVVLLLVWLMLERSKQQSHWGLLEQLCIHLLGGAIALATATALVSGIYAAWDALTEFLALDPTSSTTFRLALLVTLGPPALLFAFGVASSVSTGIVGRAYFERSREWWSRLNARFLLLGSAWCIACLLAFFALPTLKWLVALVGNWVALLGTGWIASLLAAVYGRVPEKASKKFQFQVANLLNVAASIFVAGLVFVVAAGTAAALFAIGRIEPQPAVASLAPPSVSLDFDAASDRVNYQVSVAQPKLPALSVFVKSHMAALTTVRSAPGLLPSLSLAPSAFLTVFAVLLLFGWRVDVNKFSLHNMYKNRLVRCYLGASNQGSRNEQPFIGLDDGDDVPLKALCGSEGVPPQRPFHILNTALNISQGSNLAWQERKAAAFVLTPLYCGFCLAPTQGDKTDLSQTSVGAPPPGFRPTEFYAAKDREEPGFTLGMALATSGAAVSPNMGRATHPSLAFVLTLFNARLGRWVANPACEKWRQPSPRFGVLCLLQELLGLSNEERNFVYLSDGGHFDNTGLYELVRRQCKVIFLVDAGADPERQFGDLAEAIRKCRVDLGAEITINEMPLRGDGKTMLAEQGFTEGTILYEDGSLGNLIVIKPTLEKARNEPGDVLNYAAKNRPFPQQTTSDQFFDESQFESYRRLGEYIGRACLQKHGSLLPDAEITETKTQPDSFIEQPTFATKFVASLLRRPSGRVALPAREGSLVDFFVLSAVASIVWLIACLVLDWFLLPGLDTGACLTLSAYVTQTDVLFSKGHATNPDWMFVRGQLDNAFIVAYLGTFIMGYIVAVNELCGSVRKRRYWGLLLGLCCLALLAGLVDYSENFLMLGWGSGSRPESAAADVAQWTMWKFWLIGANLLALLAVLPRIWKVFARRWMPSSAPARQQSTEPPGAGLEVG